MKKVGKKKLNLKGAELGKTMSNKMAGGKKGSK